MNTVLIRNLPRKNRLELLAGARTFRNRFRSISKPCGSKIFDLGRFIAMVEEAVATTTKTPTTPLEKPQRTASQSQQGAEPRALCGVAPGQPYRAYKAPARTDLDSHASERRRVVGPGRHGGRRRRRLRRRGRMGSAEEEPGSLPTAGGVGMAAGGARVSGMPERWGG